MILVLEKRLHQILQDVVDADNWRNTKRVPVVF